MSCAAVLSTASVGGATTSAKRCDGHLPRADAHTRKLVVYHDRGANYFACLRPAGAGLKLGPPGGLHSGDPARFIRIAGTYVTAEFDNAPQVSECIMRTPAGPCPALIYDIGVLAVKPQRHADIRVKHPIASVALSSAGAVAWADGYDSSGVNQLQGTALHARGRAGLAVAPILIYNGRIDLKSLRFTGRTVHWTTSGRPHQRTLH